MNWHLKVYPFYYGVKPEIEISDSALMQFHPLREDEM
jgi:hypothetical protein